MKKQNIEMQWKANRPIAEVGTMISILFTIKKPNADQFSFNKEKRQLINNIWINSGKDEWEKREIPN